LATVRIYKVAELLSTSSQEVMALLKQRAGIEVKSASSTIEEVVARQFVERLARERGVSLPPASKMFDETAAPVKGKKPAGKAAEPARPAGPALPPPRLVKTVKPPAPPAPEPPPPPPAPMAAEPAVEVRAVPPEPPPAVESELAVEERKPEPASAPTPAAAAPSAPQVTEPALPAAVAASTPAAAATTAAPAGIPTPTGRIVPPTLRLRIEDPNTGQAPPARPIVRPVVKAAAPPARPAPPPPSAPAQARPAARPAGPRPTSQAPLGGPRPLPSQPIRPSAPARPGVPAGARPGMPGPRPPMRPYAPRPAGLKREPPRPAPMPAPPVAPPPITRTITLAEGMTVADLAVKLDVKAKDVLKKLLERRMMMTINSTLDPDTATEIARDFGAEVQMRTFEEELLDVESEETKPEDRVTRAPVVTVMGHVDHGKTTLLDAIRETRVAEREAGGITQHIGAYRVQVGERQVVFLDTPGHEAFTMMRARGARVTDVVILVVAADDGVMPQTREAIDHAKAANVPILVAINKIDKPDANPDRVKKELSDLDLVPEEWGGKTVTVAVSAKKKQNLDLLLEMVLLVTELSELKANPKRAATGTVLEAKLDKGRGPVATVLVQDGTLNVGDTFIAGTIVGKVRALIDDRGRPVKNAPPSTPVEVLGLSGLPQPGDTFQGITDAAKARQIATFRQAQQKERALGAKGGRLTLESLQQQLAEGGVKELAIIIKADVQGSAEVLADTLSKLTDERAKIRVIHRGVGAINESDVLLASASNAIIIGFNVRPDRNAEAVAERERVEIRLHSVIYNVTDEMKKAMAGLLEPTLKETRIGIAEVRQTFKVPKFGTVAGCMVTDGRITRSGDAHARLIRDHVVVYEGKIGSLRRFKDDVSEVKAGFECGIAFERFHDVKVGDVIEAFVVERVAATA
jgi:translation initiation factor IF-2